MRPATHSQPPAPNRNSPASSTASYNSTTSSSLTMASEGSEAAQRASAGSGRSSGSRRQNPQQQLSQIEKSVTHLLVATKQLLETLTQWSRGNATEGEVSDVYVRLGYEFNIACRAFNAIGVETQDLGPVPDLLRTILEDTLSQEASQASLDRFLPRIRDIIINLLQGLKKKQSRLRARTAKDVERSGSSSRADSYESVAADGQDVPARQTSGRATRQGSRDIPTELPPRTSSRDEGRSSPAYYDSAGQRLDRFDSRNTIQSSGSSLSSTTAQSMPVVAPYPQEDTIPTQPPAPQPPPHANGQGFPPPPPAPKQQDALLALQRGGDLERRASRRFSTYQIKQQLGGAANGIPMIPPSQNSPIPNRGKEVRESIQAVRQRGSQIYSRQKSERRLVGEESPSRAVPRRISEESAPPHIDPPADLSLQDETTVKTPDDKLRSGISQSRVSATISGSIDEPVLVEPTVVHTAIPTRRPSRKAEPTAHEQFVPEESPQPGKPLTLFLQYKGKVKKFILEDASDLSIGRIQLAFIDKFAWNTHGDGVDLPEIYIQDSISGVRYELEDLGDIKNNAVLVLNVEPLDEVKRHIDEGLGQLRRVVEGIKTSLDDQQSALQRVNDRQQETAREIAGLAVTPRLPVLASPPASSTRSLSPTKATPEQLGDIQTIRRDLAIMRQTYSSFVSDIEASMTAIRTKAASVKSVAVKVALPDLKGETGRAYVNQGLETLSKEQENLVEKVEEVQDSVEDLRKDVVTRGVRPLPRQLEQVAKDISDATAEVKRMESNLAKEKPLFSKIWKAELQKVCDDRDNIAEAEALIQDFKLDLENAEKTFRLVEEATKQQNLAASQGPTGSNNPIAPRSLSGGRMAFGIDQVVDPRKAKDNVLGEVKGLKIDHEDRMEAIERAEKARQKELESRKEGAFKKELGNFVEEGRLKKTGGVEEAERLRKAKDERVRKEVWERQNLKAIDENAPNAPPSAEDRPDGLTILSAEEKAGGSSSAELGFVDSKEQQFI